MANKNGQAATAGTTGKPKAKMEGQFGATAGSNEVGITGERNGMEFTLTLPRKQAKQWANDILDAAKASKQG